MRRKDAGSWWPLNGSALWVKCYSLVSMELCEASGLTTSLFIPLLPKFSLYWAIIKGHILFLRNKCINKYKYFCFQSNDGDCMSQYPQPVTEPSINYFNINWLLSTKIREKHLREYLQFILQLYLTIILGWWFPSSPIGAY